VSTPPIDPRAGIDEIEARLAAYHPAPGTLAGRVVLVTGASRGFGRAVALAAAGAGATVVLTGRDPKALDAVYDEIAGLDAPEPMLLYVDQLGATVDDYAQIAGALDEKFGRLDGLVHAAALVGELATFASYSPIEWARVMQVNVNSVFLLTQALVRPLHRSQDASVVFVSDSLGRQGRAYWGAYAASKFALEGMMQVMAHEFAMLPGFRANTLDPGPMRTRLRAEAYPAQDPATLPDPADIAPQLVFLLGPESRGISGKALTAAADKRGRNLPHSDAV